MSRSEEVFGITYEKGEVIFHEGDIGDTMYIIQSGAVEISKSQNNNKAVLALLEQGNFFGEMALIDKHPRTATATAISRSRLLPFTRDSLIARIRNDPGVVIHLLRTLCHRINDTNNLLRLAVQNNERLRFILENNRRENMSLSEHTDSNDNEEEKHKHLSTERFQMAESHISTSMSEGPPSSINLATYLEECVRFGANEFVFRQGNLGDSLFIIIEGEVNITKGMDGDSYTLATLHPGDFFGEMAILTDKPRVANAFTTKDTLLLPVKKEDFLEKIKTEPQLALYILQGLIIRLRVMLSILADPQKSLNLIARNMPPPLQKKDKIKTAVVSLATCGGCSAILLENSHKLIELLEKVKISYCPMLIDTEEIGEVEIAIVDGMVRVKEDEEKLIETRRKCRYLVAWGTCSAFGGIPAYANQYELEDLIQESYGNAKDPFAYYLSGLSNIDRATYQEQERELKLLRRASKIDDYVRVDYYLPGCPPGVDLLIQLINELKGDGRLIKPKPIVCSECNRKPIKFPAEHFWVFPKKDWDISHCFTSRGSICLGFITKGGCGAVCPQGGLPCWGCRGPSETAFKKIEEGNSFEEFMLNSLLVRHKNMEDQVKLVMKLFRKQGQSSLRFNRNFVADRSRVR